MTGHETKYGNFGVVQIFYCTSAIKETCVNKRIIAF